MQLIQCFVSDVIEMCGGYDPKNRTSQNTRWPLIQTTRKDRTAEELGNWILSSAAFSVTRMPETASRAAIIRIVPERDIRVLLIGAVGNELCASLHTTRQFSLSRCAKYLPFAHHCANNRCRVSDEICHSIEASLLCLGNWVDWSISLSRWFPYRLRNIDALAPCVRADTNPVPGAITGPPCSWGI
jgi:hypothetical protein